MKGHVAGALRWRDLPSAWLHWRRRGDASGEDFRAAFARSLGLEADAVQLFGSGRAALHAFVASLQLPAGSEVLLPGYTCVVVPNVFMHLGLAVRYVDIRPDDFNPTADDWSAAIGPATRLVVVPHNFGQVTEGLDALKRRHPQVVFVEDAAHAWGGIDRTGRIAGTLGDAAFFSFEFSKPLTTGTGGALVIADPAQRQRFAAHRPVLHRPAGGVVRRQLLTLGWHRLTMSLPRAALHLLTGLLRIPSRMLGLVAKTPDSEISGDSQPDYRAGLHPLSAAVGLMQARRFESLYQLRRQQTADYDDLFVDLPGWQRLTGATGTGSRHETDDQDRTGMPSPSPSAPTPTPTPASTSTSTSSRGKVMSQPVLLRYPLLLPSAALRDAVIRELEAIGLVGGTWFDDVVHPRGSHRYGYAQGQCPNGERAACTVLNLPMGLHARLSARQRAALRAIAERHGGRWSRHGGEGSA
ncbi:DegT/DnrJ/EryC1/StrS family aminotransferase [Roseateles amylovorans]|uniref:DegT/DnrJ/EryC1/StrS family aminotransferase n=1 Tax=Roseateles amylovorans TaxID=2978473 RepID=A0ABY6AWU8_9BURK|nr:DegT/DnrJ/EryC1/StrS family aminotransferase [Roseateles amylovorans]UXH77651.1 DegT/DnrJ/EryC1/StrS family aminotransferase [Roseateles amylovorans]